MELKTLDLYQYGKSYITLKSDVFLYDGFQPVYVSLIGPKSAIKAARSIMLSPGSYDVTFEGKDTETFYNERKPSSYLQSVIKTLPCGWQQLLIYQHSLLNPTSSTYFYVLNNLENLLFVINKAIDIPVKKEWMDYILEYLDITGSIDELSGFGMKGYSVSIDRNEFTKEIITGLRRKHISI